MKRKRMVTYLILLAMAVSLFAGGINSQAKTKSISLNQKKLTLRVGQKKRLKVRGTSKKVKWLSSNKKVAAVSKKGVVKAKKKGKAVITAKVGKWKRKARITVKAKKKKDTSSGDNQTKQPDGTEKPVVTDKPDVTPLPTEKPGGGNGDVSVADNEKIPENLQEIPADYYTEIDRQGSLVELNYETYESKTYEQKSRKLNKRAIVYLPYGYSEKERYNVFYLMHGGWSNETTWLGTPEHPGTFKNVIDHAVSDGKMKPFIIVCPTYNNESPSDSGDYTLAYGTLTVNYHNELMNDLIPAVEGTYSTYAGNVTPEGIKASRDHRAFGGFSMGSVATWHTFLNCLDAFRYFMPSSGAIDSSGNRLDRAVAESGYTWKDFFIFAATGTSDFACSQFTNQINGMLGQESGNFREADNETEGNLAFRIKEGYSHDWRASAEYAYNGMLWFWNHGSNKQSVEKVTEDTLVRDVINNPVFGNYGRLLFPVHKNISDTLTLGNVGDILTWYHNVRAEKTVEIVNTLLERAAGGEIVFYDIYSDEEKQADSAKADTGLFFFKGKPGAKFAVVNAGGGFVYVGAMHDSFPVALELSKKGYNAFALIYRPGEQTACEDLARAVSFIHQHKEELEVDTEDYSLWGGSAGARMAAVLGNRDYLQELTGRKDIPQASVVIMQYTGYTDTSSADAPTYACVGTSDGIASADTMKSRLEKLEKMGIPTEFHSYKGLSHGFGLGTGTVAEGWLDDAVQFWERLEGTK